MITLWIDGKYFDSWFNTMSDQYFMEVTMANLGLDPSRCEWIEYGQNPNGHNPKQIDDATKSFEWIVDEVVPMAVVTDGTEVPAKRNNYLKLKAFLVLSRILSSQNKILEDNFIDTEDIPEIPTTVIANNVVENKVVMNPMQTLNPQEEIFSKGSRLKLYAGETELPPKMEKLADVAKFLLAKKIDWNVDFRQKLTRATALK